MSLAVMFLNVRDAPDVADETVVQLTSWRVVRAGNRYHICAQLRPGVFRFSTPLANVDFNEGFAITSSGRRYEFKYPPESDKTLREILWSYATDSGLAIFEDISATWWQAIMHSPDMFPELKLLSFTSIEQPPSAP